MDINTLRIAATLLSFAAFVGICVWALSRRNASRFEEAAQLPFVHESPASDSGQDAR
ncbi:MAG: cbb3-type cytochrome c oxidase subunit 3 [Betaproteobacteria bacterium]|nr:cbb3-type cytochrome c oxidase subunit 3 [Betaproteobacteria bacterium]NBS48019.1 cbb3-type cytochrome c oxidase subunit 3 [Betaproteobacteria bacterium]